MGPGGAAAVAYMGQQGVQAAHPESNFLVSAADIAAAAAVAAGPVDTDFAVWGSRPRLEIALVGRGSRSPPKRWTAS